MILRNIVVSTIGVFVKDISKITGSFINIMMFESIFYPTDPVPTIKMVKSSEPIGYVIRKQDK